MKLVVVGTDTGVGKTLVSGLIARSRARVAYWKPVATGAAEGSDGQTVRALAPAATIIPETYAFEPPIAPHLAAARAGTAIDLARLLADHAAIDPELDLVVEGIGGVLVPLTEEASFADLIRALGLPALVVARTALGTINHTLLTLEALRARGVEVLGVVFSGPPEPEVCAAIERIGRARVLAQLPHVEDPRALHLELAFEADPKASWVALDQAHVWRPYTPMKLAPPPLPVVRSEGVHLILADGRRVIDAIGSWWVNVHGHCHPELTRALTAQAAQLDQIIYASCAHQSGAELAGSLAELTGLPRVFYTDDGSTAVEAALKIAYQSWTNRGVRGRKLLITLEGAYHGDTLGAMSAGADGVYHAAFRDLLFEVEKVRPGDGSLSAALERHGEIVFAVIVEPMVQGAAGMRFMPASFLAEARALTAQRGIPLIADEVFTGFGRTGRMFACEHAGITPDLMCLSKALTGGVMAFGAVLASEALFADFVSDDRTKTLFHGHSYTGNPLACAVANASLRLIDLPRVRAIEARLHQHLAALAAHPRVHATRALGAIAAIDLTPEGTGGYLDPIGPRLARRALAEGVLVRPLGDVLYLTPPYSITDAQLDQVFGAIRAALDA